MTFKFSGFTVYPGLNKETEYPLWLRLVGTKNSPNRRDWHNVLIEVIRLAVFVFHHKEFFTPEQWSTLRKVVKGEYNDTDRSNHSDLSVEDH